MRFTALPCVLRSLCEILRQAQDDTPTQTCQEIRRLIQQRRIVGYRAGLAGQVAALARLQSETTAAIDALLPSVLDKAFKGEL